MKTSTHDFGKLKHLCMEAIVFKLFTYFLLNDLKIFEDGYIIHFEVQLMRERNGNHLPCSRISYKRIHETIQLDQSHTWEFLHMHTESFFIFYIIIKI